MPGRTFKIRLRGQRGHVDQDVVLCGQHGDFPSDVVIHDDKAWRRLPVMEGEAHLYERDVRVAFTRSSDDPELDATDGAHPAWWRGSDHAVGACASQVALKLGIGVPDGIQQGRWQAVMSVLESVVDLVREDAEEPCHYGDGCPSFAGTRHGTCRSCRAKRALKQT